MIFSGIIHTVTLTDKSTILVPTHKLITLEQRSVMNWPNLQLDLVLVTEQPVSWISYLCCNKREHFFLLGAVQAFHSKLGRANHFCLFPNLKHLLCLDSAILGAWESRPLFRLENECFSIALMNLRICLMYSGNVSRLQCPPPSTHNGSYFSLASSHKRLPCEKSTTSSLVPCKWMGTLVQLITYRNFNC